MTASELVANRTSLPSLRALYADPRRKRSRERDLGLRWRARDGSTYRAAWIEETEELYAVRHLDHDGHGGSVRILGRLPAERVERAAREWPAQCDADASFEWLCWQVRRLPR
ncbi:hypothetical protein [Conexibacter sp. CPCC 206217]|uniref:hypothetical protein n=1 Tax=Conexibacter sp. CPCC 206217 TaxID=3064574 RepID=UPI0027271F27|nr:hypothetical protein [Conexibacter sp. CPCC 206217]MDO8213682.1 hypothetical protein [Conexibacter sp. CPCC 206217]